MKGQTAVSSSLAQTLLRHRFNHLAITLLLALIINTNAQIFEREERPKIVQTQAFRNQIVEENEQILLPLNDYFSGSLLEYRMKITGQDGRQIINEDLEQLINITDPFKVLAYDQLREDTFESHSEPFPRSTLFLKEYYQNKMSMYMVDRNFNFIKYDVTEYSLEKVTKVYSVQLNTTIVNQKCSDLMYIEQTNSLYLFCISLSQESGLPFSYNTIVSIESFMQTSEPTIRYLSYFKNYDHPDLDLGLKYMGQEYDFGMPSYRSALLLSYQPHFNGTGIYNRLCLTKFNLLHFLNMAVHNQYYEFLDVGNHVIETKSQIEFDEALKEDNIIDFLLLCDQTFLIGVLFKEQGLLTCRMSFTMFIQDFDYVPICHGDYAQFIEFDNVLSLYKNYDDYDRFYITLSSPPGVVELDMTVNHDVYIHKVYYSNDRNVGYIGRPVIAVNNNYIVHMIENIITGQQSLRVFCRNKNYFNTAKADYLLPKTSKTNFFAFPNYYLNIFWYRDEKFVNSTAFFDYQLGFHAQNSKLVLAYKQQTLRIELTAISPNGDSKTVNFDTIFVEHNNTQIASVVKDIDNNQQIFYNCGENDFQYTVSEYFNGPNYKLEPIQSSNTEDCEDGFCYFKFVNKNFSKRLEQEFDQSKCQVSYMFSYMQQKDEGSANTDRMILVCIDKNSSTLTSFILCMPCGKIIQTSQVTIPQLEFLEFGHDEQDRILFVIGKVVNQPWVDKQFEIHFFEVQNELLWVDYYQIPHDFNDLDNILSFSYNSQHQKAVYVTKVDENCKQNFQYFGISYLDDHNLYEIIHQNFDLCEKDQIIKVMVSEDRFFFTLQANNQVNVYEVSKVPPSVFHRVDQQINRMWFKQFPSEFKIHTFDIYDSKYFIIYYDYNSIEVWTIEMKIYLTYKMKLPLYTFSNLEFNWDNTRSIASIWRTYYQENFGILLTCPYSDTSFLIIYCLESTQHNSFSMSKDFSEIFLNSQTKSISITGDGTHNHLTLISDDRIQLHDVVFHNHLALTDDEKQLKNLIKNCSQMKIEPDEQGILQDKPHSLAVVQMKPISMFENSDHPDYQPEDNIIDFGSGDIVKDQIITVNIYSQNQGLAITPTISNNVNISFSKDAYIRRIEGQVLLEQLVEGYNLKFKASCSYYDTDGQLQDCSKDGIVDETSTSPYQFYIEFVTQERKVLKSFTMGRLFFIFDTKYYLTVFKLPNDIIDLQSINGYALEKVAEFNQLDLLGCNIEDYVSYNYFYKKEFEDPHDSYTLYFLFYQCPAENDNQLKVAEIRIYDIQSEYRNFDIRVFKGGIRIPNRIIDTDQVNITIQFRNIVQVYAKIAVTANIEGSFSNLFQVYQVWIDILESRVHFELKASYQSVIAKKDTFKVSQLLAVPDSNLMLIVDTDSGFYIFDMETYQILVEFDITQDNHFNQQNLMQYGKMEVFSIAADWPYSIHVVSNYGLFIYSFNVSLTDRAQIFPNEDKTLVPYEKRIIRMNFDYFDQQLAMNKYGYAFLMKKFTGKNTFDVYVGAISFYSSTNSKFFKMVYVTSNQECLSLNEVPYVTDTQEDMLAVSFVCDTQLYIIRICMRPHIVFQMDDFKDKATRKVSESSGHEAGALNFNQFHIAVEASNQYTVGDINKAIVNVNLEYKGGLDKGSSGFYIICLIVFGILAMLFVFLFQYTFKTKEDSVVSYQQTKRDQSMNLSGIREMTYDPSPLSAKASVLQEGLDLQKLNAEEQAISRFTLLPKKDTRFTMKQKRLSLEDDKSDDNLSDGLYGNFGRQPMHRFTQAHKKSKTFLFKKQPIKKEE